MKTFFKDAYWGCVRLMRKFYYPYLYKREGSCQQCGKCCRHVYLRDEGVVLKEFEQYFQMIQREKKMQRFKVKGRDQNGFLYFSCDYISTKNQCMDYENRPDICRAYPALAMIRNSVLPKPDCGFTFKNRLTQITVTE